MDLGCLLLDNELNVTDHVSFRHLRSSCGSVIHGGDARDDVGGDLDDEQIFVTLDTLPPIVHYIVFCLNCFDGRQLSAIETCSGHLFETALKRDLVLCDCVDEDIKRNSAVMLCLLVRAKQKWMFLNISRSCAGTELNEIVPHLKVVMAGSVELQNMLNT